MTTRSALGRDIAGTLGFPPSGTILVNGTPISYTGLELTETPWELLAGDVPHDEGTPSHMAPEQAPQPRRGRWSRRCPCCRSSALTNAPRGALQCVSCHVLVPSPSRGDELAPWETDPRLAGEWDDYSRAHPCGGLLAVWGRSTDRADGGPPRGLDSDGHEDLPPQVRAAAVLGEADELLDEAITASLELTAGLVEAIDQVKPLAIRLARADGAHRSPRKPARSRPTPPRPHARTRAPEAAGVPVAVLEQLAAEQGVVVDDQRHHFRDTVEASGPSTPALAEIHEPGDGWYYPRVVAATSVALLGCVRALALLAVNALRARGVEYLESTEQVRARSTRTQPFGGYRHALAAAFGLVDQGESSAIPHGAVALHALPQGMVLNGIACKPSRSYAAHAREPDTGADDVVAAICAARVGARTYSEGGRIRRDPGRPLTLLELELVRLVDAGEEHLAAVMVGQGRRRRVERLAIEPLDPRDALAVLRAAGWPDVPRTEHEAKILLAGARRAIRRVLEARGLIPGLADAVEGVRLPQASGPTPPTGDRRRRRVA